MLYAYKARKSASEAVSGTIEANDERAALAALKRIGYQPFEITRQGRSTAALGDVLGGRVRVRDVALFSRQMSTLVGAGIGLSEALTLVGRQVANARLKSAMAEVQSRVEDGETLHQAMASHPEVFPPLLVSVVAAGEAGGMLTKVLDSASEHYEALEELKGKVTGALIYPVFLFAVGVAAIWVLVTFVVPRFSDLFAAFGQELPVPTQLLLSVSRFMGAYWWAVLGAVAVAALSFRQAIRSRAGRLAWDTFKLGVPVYGALVVKLETTRFARTLGALLENGVPMLSALDVVADTLGNGKIAADLRRARAAVEEGARLGEALEKHTVLADMAYSLIRVGESSGSVSEMLYRTASVYQKEVDRSARALTVMLEPVLIIALGGCVAFVVLSILLPIFRLNVLVQ